MPREERCWPFRRCSPRGGGGDGGGDGGELKDVLNFSNWELYIDTPDTRKAAGLTGPTTLEQFTAKTKIKVNYFEDVISNSEYFATVQGRLRAGAGDRPRHHRVDRQRPLPEHLHRQRLGTEARQEPHPEHREPHRRAGEPAVRSRTGSTRSPGSREWTGSHGTRTSPGLSRTVTQLLEDPKLKGKVRRLELDGRHARSRHAREWRRPGEGHGRVVRPCARRDPESPGRGADPTVLRQRLRATARNGRSRREHGVVRRHPQSRRSEDQMGNRREGRDHLDRQHAHPARRQRADSVDVHELRVRPEDRRGALPRGELHLLGQGREGTRRRSLNPDAAANTLAFPTEDMLSQMHQNDPTMFANPEYEKRWLAVQGK